MEVVELGISGSKSKDARPVSVWVSCVMNTTGIPFIYNYSFEFQEPGQEKEEPPLKGEIWLKIRIKVKNEHT